MMAMMVYYSWRVDGRAAFDLYSVLLVVTRWIASCIGLLDGVRAVMSLTWQVVHHFDDPGLSGGAVTAPALVAVVKTASITADCPSLR